MTVGFTGTSQGMSTVQNTTLLKLLRDLKVTTIHHGDCIGSDASLHKLARYTRLRIYIHPPSITKKRAFCLDAHHVFGDKPYTERNRAIVVAGVDGLIATPAEFSEQQRFGTWSTVRYARKMKRKIWIILPDGTIREE